MDGFGTAPQYQKHKNGRKWQKIELQQKFKKSRKQLK